MTLPRNAMNPCTVVDVEATANISLVGLGPLRSVAGSDFGNASCDVRPDIKSVLLLAALAASIVPASALEWHSRDNMSSIENDPDGGCLMENHDMMEPVHCEIVHWPVDEAVGFMECNDGENRSNQIKNRTTLIISRHEFYRYD